MYPKLGKPTIQRAQSEQNSSPFIIGRVTKTEYDTGIIYYEQYSNIDDINKIQNNSPLNSAKPFNSYQKQYPQPGEIVLIISGPNSKSITEETNSQNYYIGIINIWNNTNNNSQYINQDIPFEQKQVPTIQGFPGDIIQNGRYNNNIRFSSTKTKENNFWNEGEENSPITIISQNEDKLENLEKDNILILSSTQKIPIKTFSSNSNKITKTTLPKNSSFKSQFLNAERIVLNTLKDDILLYSYKNTEIYSQENISLNSPRTLIDSDKICLGQNGENEPTEPALLGNKTEDLLRDLLKAISSFSNKVSSTISTPQGTPLVTLNIAAQSLTTQITKIISKLDKIKSNTVYLK